MRWVIPGVLAVGALACQTHRGVDDPPGGAEETDSGETPGTADAGDGGGSGGSIPERPSDAGAPVAVDAGPTPAHDAGPQPAPTQPTLRVEVRDETAGALAPAKLVLVALDAGSNVPRIEFISPSGSDIALPRGRYRATVARGFEYTRHTATVDLESTLTARLDVSLRRVVDTTGYLSGDFHVHTNGSFDSTDPADYKAAAASAEGLEILVSTEHDNIVDLRPGVADAGVGAWVNAIMGDEVSTGYGHFNAFPLALDRTARQNGAIQWYQKTAPTLFAHARRSYPQAIWQVNHPRMGMVGGYFNAAGYNAQTGVASNSSGWSDDFDTLEVVNGNGWREFENQIRADWFSFLNRGKRVTATGNSDSHFAARHAVGYPRNYVVSSTDDPRAANESEFIANVRAGRVVVSGGIFVTASMGGATPGALFTPSGTSPSIHVKAQAAPWVSVTKIEIYANGQRVAERTLAAPGGAPPVVRFDDDIPLAFTRDTWVVAIATGTGTLDPVAAGAKPFGFTNAIYVDVNANGRFDAPLP